MTNTDDGIGEVGGFFVSLAIVLFIVIWWNTDIGFFPLLLIFVAIGLVIVLAIVAISISYAKDHEKLMRAKREERDKKLEPQRVKALAKINCKDNLFVSNGRGVAIDAVGKQFALLESWEFKPMCKVIPYSDVLAVEIVVNGETVTTTVTQGHSGSVVGGAIIGGILAGGAGAVVGGLAGGSLEQSSESETTTEITSVRLRITINDVDSPTHIINCGKMVNIAKNWHDKITVVIHQADEEAKLQSKKDMENTVAVVQPTSVTDELAKLGELRDKGVLTEKEFQAQKKKLGV